MCGPSQNQQSMFGNEQALSTLLSANFNQRFADQTQLLDSLKNTFTPIVQAGADQQGMGPKELAALHTQSTEAVGGNYAKASRALNNQLAVRGGGTGDVSTGGDAQLQEELAQAGAAQSSNEDLAITKANFDLGRQKWSAATAGLNALVGETNPTQYASLASGANQTAFGEATQIQQMKNQKEMEIAGGISSLALGAATFGAAGVANLGAGESFGEGVGDFFKGGLSTLGGKG